MSSRNTRLTEASRQQAPEIYRALQEAKAAYLNGETQSSELLKRIDDHLTKNAPIAQIDYLECVDAATLEPVETTSQKSVIAIAAFFGDVRLIDNIELTPLS